MRRWKIVHLGLGLLIAGLITAVLVGLRDTPPPKPGPLTDLAPAPPVLAPGPKDRPLAEPGPVPERVIPPREMPHPEDPPHGTELVTPVDPPTPPDLRQPPPVAVDPSRHVQ